MVISSPSNFQIIRFHTDRMKFLQILHIEIIPCNSLEDLLPWFLREFDQKNNRSTSSEKQDSERSLESHCGGIKREKEKTNEEEDDD